MKWFKHISDSVDDPFIFELIEKFGSDGYLLFFGIIEIYAREFKPDEEWRLEVSMPYVCSKLLHSEWQVSHKLVPSFLQVMQESGKWDITTVELKEKKDGTKCVFKASIFIKKFTELLDEWTLRKLGSRSGVTPKKLSTDKDKDKDKEKEKEKEKTLCENTSSPSEKTRTEYEGDFEKFWQAYPKRTGSKKAAHDQWRKLNGSRPPLATLLGAINTQIDWRKNARDGEFRPVWRDPERWLRGRLWEMETPCGEGGDKDPHEETPKKPVVTRVIRADEIAERQRKRDMQELEEVRRQTRTP